MLLNESIKEKVNSYLYFFGHSYCDSLKGLIDKYFHPETIMKRRARCDVKKQILLMCKDLEAIREKSISTKTAELIMCENNMVKLYYEALKQLNERRWDS